MSVLHETCREYFKRRLSEGWKCINFEGHNAVLLSPDGIRRELDLRNDIETLRPSAPGDLTECIIGGDFPAATNWESVDEAVPDGNNTYVQSTTPSDWYIDLYNIPDSGVGIGTIISVTVWVRVRMNYSSPQDSIKVALKTGGTVYESAEKTVTHNVWENHSEVWAQNPGNAHAWTWDEIDALQIGVDLECVFKQYGVYCTQVYVEVDYTPAVGLENKSANMGSKMVAAGLI